MAEKKAESRAKMPKMIKGKTTSGLQYQINPRVKDDMRILMYLNQIRDKDLGAGEKMEAFDNFLKLIFGDQVPAFMNEVAARHNGVADMASISAELSEILSDDSLKKS